MFSQGFLPGTLSLRGAEEDGEEGEGGAPSPENLKISVLSVFLQGFLKKTTKNIRIICVFTRFPAWHTVPEGGGGRRGGGEQGGGQGVGTEILLHPYCIHTVILLYSDWRRW